MVQCGRNYHVSLRIYYYVIFFRRSVDYSPPSFLSFFAHLPNHLRFSHALYPKCIQNTKYILYAIQFVLRRILNPTCPASNRLPNNPKPSNLFRLEDFFKSITSYFWLYSSRGEQKRLRKKLKRSKSEGALTSSCLLDFYECHLQTEFTF